MFDSGVGGLTVARSVLDQLPHEQVLYIGGHRQQSLPVPGTIAEVRSLALSIMDELVDRGVKLLVIACNTASAAVLHDARERYTLGRGVPGHRGHPPGGTYRGPSDPQRQGGADRHPRDGRLARLRTTPSRPFPASSSSHRRARVSSSWPSGG